MSVVAEDRRKQILSAASACFARHGFHQASMQEICKEAELSPGSVYRYFRSKDDLIAALIDNYRQTTCAMFVTAREEPDVVAAIVGMAKVMLSDIDPLHFECTAEAVRNPRVGKLVREFDAEAVTELTELIRVGQKKNHIDKKLDPVTTARTLIALIDGLMWRKFIDPTADVASFLDTIRTLLVRFLKPTHGEPS
jgi:TetR/AcrR family transcriptional regulator, repressor for uid operon